MSSLKWILLILFLCNGYLHSPARQTGRVVESISNNWKFQKGDTSSIWENIQIPHTWNDRDPFDETAGYFRGLGWYKKQVFISGDYPSSFLYFEAANQKTKVWVNGVAAGEHKGGYTAFCFDISDHVKSGMNEILVRVDNSHDDTLVPLKGDFNFYGGIYRDVHLLSTGNIYFDPTNMAAPGVRIRTEAFKAGEATVWLNGHIINRNDSKEKVALQLTLLDPSGEEVMSNTIRMNLDPGENSFDHEFKLNDPELWSLSDPNLYSLSLTILDSEDRTSDTIEEVFGLRWIRFDADEGFFLNGEPVKLIGVNRHQDYPGLGNALPERIHLEDLKKIRAMGANFLRTAHYPQDKSLIEACDRLGILVSMEIPLDHDIRDLPEFYANTNQMMKEMIRQYYNHPSVIIWAYMNEMFLGRNAERDKEIIHKIVDYARRLESLIRSEDPDRYTMIPNHGDLDIYRNSGITNIPMIVGWNLYYGWYEPDLTGMGAFVDKAHEANPDKPIIITEYGAGADPRLRSADPLRFDFSLDWQLMVHAENLNEIQKRSFVAASAVWNMFDFGSENRNDAVPKINSKGLCSYDRKPKPAYYVYKSALSHEPFARIIDPFRSNEEELKVFAVSNRDKLVLDVNGSQKDLKSSYLGLFSWTVPFSAGPMELNVTDEEGNQLDSQRLVISVDTDSRYYNMGTELLMTEENGIEWLPAERFGVLVGDGVKYSPRNRGIGSDRDILGTVLDPVFQTMISNLSSVSLDVPSGIYDLEFLFCELEYEMPGERVFSVNIEDRQLIRELDLARDAGKFHAVQKKVRIEHKGGPLTIEFEQVKGSPVINGLTVQKIK